MEGLLKGIPYVSIYLDDILITGTSDHDEEHLATLDKVLSCLEEAELRLKCNKCAFMFPSVVYLGHKILAESLQPTGEKAQAVNEAPPPNNISSFLGLVNYYGKFLPHLASTLKPLYTLLQKTKSFCWGPGQDKAFKEANSC